MKKRYILAGLLASSLSLFGQHNKSMYSKTKLRETEVQTLLSYYTQDNNHSAVTGGKGTEDLQVYAVQLLIDWGNDSLLTYHIDTGVDIISSASTDNIDFVKSSASKNDARGHINLGFSKPIHGTGYSYGANAGISVESDYYSRTAGLSLAHVSPEQAREWSLSFQAYFDDLRWGRFDDDEPLQLLYPREMRRTEWFTTYVRNSFNLTGGIFQTINSRMSLGIYPGIMYQCGLLSTTFHRVYFSDNSKRVENLPNKRLKFPLGVQLNTFLGSRTILRTYYRYYWDNFGIAAHTLEFELPVKLGFAFGLTPFVRLYSQSQADHFAPYAEHAVTQEFYTSDYDLSKFTSYKGGLGFRFTQVPFKQKKLFALDVHYAFYKRSDGMTAHMVTTLFDLSTERLVDRKRK